MIVQNSPQLMALLAADESSITPNVKDSTSGTLFAKQLVERFNKISEDVLPRLPMIARDTMSVSDRKISQATDEHKPIDEHEALEAVLGILRIFLPNQLQADSRIPSGFTPKRLGPVVDEASNLFLPERAFFSGSQNRVQSGDGVPLTDQERQVLQASVNGGAAESLALLPPSATQGRSAELIALPVEGTSLSVEGEPLNGRRVPVTATDLYQEVELMAPPAPVPLEQILTASHSWSRPAPETATAPVISALAQRASRLDALRLHHGDFSSESRLIEALTSPVAKDSQVSMGATYRPFVSESTVNFIGFMISPDVIDEMSHTEGVNHSNKSAELIQLGAVLIAKDKTQQTPVRADEPGQTISLPIRQAANPALAIDVAVTESEVQKRSSAGVAEVDRQVRIRHDVPQGTMRLKSDYSPDREALLPGLRPEGTLISPPATSAAEVIGRVLPQRELSAVSELPTERGDSSLSPSQERPTVAISHSYTLRQNTVVLQLDPPDLGSLVVHIQRNPEQLRALFWAESAEARTLLQSHLPALQEALTQLGLPVQEVTLQLISDKTFLYQFGPELGPSFEQPSDQQNTTSHFAQQHQGRPYSEAQDPVGFEDFTPEQEGREQLVDIII